MERIAFLVEHTGVRLACLLNPESLVISRTASRPPCPSKSKWRPNEPIGRPLPPGCWELKKPKNTPAPGCDAVMAKVPAAVSLSLSDRGAICTAYDAGVVERWITPPTSLGAADG